MLCVYLQELLSFKHPHVANSRLQIERPESHCERWFQPPWDELIAAHLRYCNFINVCEGFIW